MLSTQRGRATNQMRASARFAPKKFVKRTSFFNLVIQYGGPTSRRPTYLAKFAAATPNRSTCIDRVDGLQVRNTETHLLGVPPCVFLPLLSSLR